jgi:hypothetical protein
MAKKIPYRKIDRMVRFWPSEIQEWVNKKMKPEKTAKNEAGGNAWLLGDMKSAGGFND